MLVDGDIVFHDGSLASEALSRSLLKLTTEFCHANFQRGCLHPQSKEAPQMENGDWRFSPCANRKTIFLFTFDKLILKIEMTSFTVASHFS